MTAETETALSREQLLEALEAIDTRNRGTTNTAPGEETYKDLPAPVLDVLRTYKGGLGKIASTDIKKALEIFRDWYSKKIEKEQCEKRLDAKDAQAEAEYTALLKSDREDLVDVLVDYEAPVQQKGLRARDELTSLSSTALGRVPGRPQWYSMTPDALEAALTDGLTTFDKSTVPIFGF
ncbi:hypothetical protein ACIOML_28605 [Streptomyces anulatus]